MRNRTNILDNVSLLSIGLLLCTFLSCVRSPHPDITGTGTETENKALVSGRVLYGNGSAAKNAEVLFVAADQDPNAAVNPSSSAADTCTTDSLGFYYTNTLSVGVWNILSTDAACSAKAYRTSVLFTGETLHIADLSLLSAGSLHGTIKLLPSDDPKSAAMDVIGALVRGFPESDGSFVLGPLAAGDYRIRIRADAAKYEVLDTVLSVLPGINRVLDSPIVLPLKIPIPQGFALTYAPRDQVVSLRWFKGPAARIHGYNVYRQRKDTLEQQLNILPLSDTTFFDSFALQDSTYYYQVAGVDSNGFEGVKTGRDTIVITSVLKPISVFGGDSSGAGRFSEIGGMKHLKNGNLAVLDFMDNRVKMLDSTGRYLFSWGSKGTGDGQFMGPDAVTEDDSGYIYILEILGAGRIQKFTADGAFLASWAMGPYCHGLTYNYHNLYVTNVDSSGFKVLDLTSGAVTLKPVGKSSPFGIAVNSASRVYLCNVPGDSITVTDTNGVLLASWGRSGFNNSELLGPTGIVCAPNGRIIVPDRNGRIQAFDSTGAFIAKHFMVQVPKGTFDGPFDRYPRALTIDVYGNLFAADAHYIYKFNGCF